MVYEVEILMVDQDKPFGIGTRRTFEIKCNFITYFNDVILFHNSRLNERSDSWSTKYIKMMDVNIMTSGDVIFSSPSKYTVIKIKE